MADQELSGMFVLLGLNQVGFEEGSNKARDTARRTANDIDKSFSSVTDARHGLMLTEEAFGIRIPRSLNTLLAKIPGVSAAFSAILPIAGIAVAVELIGKLIEKHDALAAAQAKATRDTANLTISERDRTEGLQLENLKLQDQIDKIEGRPTRNRLAEALLESKIKADELATGLDGVQSKLEETFEKESSFGGTISRVGSAMAAFDTHGGVKADNAELKNLQASYGQVLAARNALSESKGTSGESAALAGLTAAYKQYGEAALNAFVAVRTNEKDNIVLLNSIRQAQITATSGQEDMAAMAENAQKRMRLAADEDAAEAKDRAEKDAKTTAEAAAIKGNATIDAESAAAKHLLTIHQINAEDELKIERDLQDRKLTIIEDGLRAEIAALSGSTKPDDINKVKILDAQLEAAKQKHLQTLTDLDDSYFTRLEQRQLKSIDTQAAYEEKLATIQRDHATAVATYKEKLGIISSASMLTAQRSADDLFYKEMEDALNKQIALKKQLDPLDPDKYQADQDKLLEIQREHKLKLQEDDQKYFEGEKKQWDSFFGTLDKGFASSVADAVVSHKNILASFQGMAQNALKNWIQTLVEMKVKTADAKLFDSIFGASRATNPLSDVSTKITASSAVLTTSSVKLDASSTALLTAAATWDATAAQILAAAAALSASSATASAGSALSSFSLAGFASGGDVAAGVPIMVGENGPEPFIPRTAGTIIPNSAWTGGGRGNTYNVNNTFTGVRDMDSFRASDAQIMGRMQNAVNSAARRNT